MALGRPADRCAHRWTKNMSQTPVLPLPPEVYSKRYMDELTKILRQYIERESLYKGVRATTVDINVDSLPTDAALASLRAGSVYRDTTAGNSLKVKV